MNLLQRVENITKVWQIMLPHLPAPSPETVGRWLFYNDSAIESAIVRTASKFKREKIDLATFDAVQAYRYTTGTAKLITEEKAGQQHSQQRHAER
jgi:hypothetical protein